MSLHSEKQSSSTLNLSYEQWATAQGAAVEDYQKYVNFGSEGFVTVGRMYHTYDQIPIEIRKSKEEKVFRFEVSDEGLFFHEIPAPIIAGEVQETQQVYSGNGITERITYVQEKEKSPKLFIFAFILILLVAITYLSWVVLK